MGSLVQRWWAYEQNLLPSEQPGLVENVSVQIIFPSMISPLLPGSPMRRQPPAKPCQCQLRGNLCTGRRFFSSSFPCQAPKCASRWWKLRFEMLFLSFCQHNIWDGCTLCDILVVNKHVSAVRKILHGNEMLCMPSFTTSFKLFFFFIIFKKSVELDHYLGRQDQLRRTNWKENLWVCGYQNKRQKGRIASMWLFIFHPLAALCPCLLNPHFLKVEGDIKRLQKFREMEARLRQTLTGLYCRWFGSRKASEGL